LFFSKNAVFFVKADGHTKSGRHLYSTDYAHFYYPAEMIMICPAFYFYQDSKFPIKLITTKSDSRSGDNSAAEYARAGRLTDGGECAGNHDGAVFKFRAAYKLMKTDV
jgi:hypothetical protein